MLRAVTSCVRSNFCLRSHEMKIWASLNGCGNMTAAIKNHNLFFTTCMYVGIIWIQLKIFSIQQCIWGQKINRNCRIDQKQIKKVKTKLNCNGPKMLPWGTPLGAAWGIFPVALLCWGWLDLAQYGSAQVCFHCTLRCIKECETTQSFFGICCAFFVLEFKALLCFDFVCCSTF